MIPNTLPPDDTSPAVMTAEDVILKRKFEQTTCHHFFEACGGLLQSVLVECEWNIYMTEVLILVIYCPDAHSNWRVLNHIAKLAKHLAQFSNHAKIRVYPPEEAIAPFELRVDERSVYGSH